MNELREDLQKLIIRTLEFMAVIVIIGLFILSLIAWQGSVTVPITKVISSNTDDYHCDHCKDYKNNYE
jgi:hypothetical protein